jgi:predicted transcriptional regulator
MIKNTITIHEEAALEEAVKLMTEKGLKRCRLWMPRAFLKGLISKDSVLQAALVRRRSSGGTSG